MDIQRTLGRIEQKIDGHVTSFAQHVADDQRIAKALFERIEPLQLEQARQKGAARVWSLVGAAGGAILGIVGSYVSNRH
jgi:hypothetical protein